VHDLALRMQKVHSLEQSPNRSANERLRKSVLDICRLGPHEAQTHLRGLQNEDEMTASWAKNSERAKDPADAVLSGMLARSATSTAKDVAICPQLALHWASILAVDFESDVFMLTASSLQVTGQSLAVCYF
jgi:hypothetical protein